MRRIFYSVRYSVAPINLLLLTVTLYSSVRRTLVSHSYNCVRLYTVCWFTSRKKTWYMLNKFKVCKSVHHRTIQIDHQPHATIFQFIILTFIYSSTCFGRSPAHHQELNDCSSSLWFYLRIVVIAVLFSWSDRPRTQHDCHHDTKVKPEAATAVVELLMMGGRMHETCCAVNKRQDNKLKKLASGWWSIWIVLNKLPICGA